LTDDPAWPLVQQWAAEATNPHRLLPARDDVGEATLASLDGITEKSVLGALARNAAALIVDDWLVILGAGGDGYPGLRDLNEGEDSIDGALIAGVDALGGGFLINGGGVPTGEPGEVCYLAPDELDWMDTGLKHSGWVHWALTGPLDRFYEDLRWPGWRDEAGKLAPGQGIAAYPPPWSEEGRGSDVHRSPAPLTELWGVLLSTYRQVS
jgi:hypothetical protein